jgi:hypothetical protein
MLLWMALGASGFAAEKSAPPSELPADAIVAKNIAARGGLEAWRNIDTMIWTGRLESAGSGKPSMPFVLEQKRPNKTRFEIQMMGERTMRIFDGAEGWKLHTGPGGRPAAEPFTAEEMRFARSEQAIDGPLMDSEARGSTVALAGIERLEGRKTYRLMVRLSSGERQFVWVDAETFLDVKVARLTFSEKGQPRMAPVFYRRFQTFEGVKIPTSIEIGDPASGPTDRMDIERVALNAPMSEHLFAKPGAAGRNAAARGAEAPADVAKAGALQAPAAPSAGSGPADR